MEVKITKEIVSGGRTFSIGSSINFTLIRNEKHYNCFGVIGDISEESFTLKKVVIDDMNVSDVLTIHFYEVKDGDISSANLGWD